MPKFSQRSLDNLSQCHPDLQIIAHELIKEMDVVVICGHRGEKEQNEAFDKGYSKLRWPNSKHNSKPSMAMDVCPYPIDFQAKAKFLEMRGVMQRIADEQNIKVKFIKWDLDHLQLDGYG